MKTKKKAVEVTEEGGTIKSVETLEVVIEGGPLGRDTEFTVDGVKPPKVTKVVLESDVGDVMRLTTTQILLISHVRAQVASWERKILARLHIWSGTAGKDAEAIHVIEGSGANVIEALEDALEKLRQAEGAPTP